MTSEEQFWSAQACLRLVFAAACCRALCASNSETSAPINYCRGQEGFEEPVIVRVSLTGSDGLHYFQDREKHL